MPPSVFTIVVGVCFGMTPGVLLRVMRACTLGVARMLARVVGVDDVFALFCCCVSKLSVALSNIFLIFLMLGHAVPCLLLVPLRYLGWLL